MFNRAGFFKFAPNVIKEAISKGNKLFVLFLDLDGLKSINDRYGHDEGDSFIRAMGNVLSKVRGHGELLMRYGGDGTARETRRRLEEAGLLSEGPGEVIIENSCPSPQILELSWRLLGQPREREK